MCSREAQRENLRQMQWLGSNWFDQLGGTAIYRWGIGVGWYGGEVYYLTVIKPDFYALLEKINYAFSWNSYACFGFYQLLRSQVYQRLKNIIIATTTAITIAIILLPTFQHLNNCLQANLQVLGAEWHMYQLSATVIVAGRPFDHPFAGLQIWGGRGDSPINYR